MPRFIHLNGPAGVGKSTVAQMYVDQHPGALNLDMDHVVSQIGGWRQSFWEALALARQLASAMAETHLRNGRDVIWPQVASRASEVEGLEQAAHRADADYREVVLMVDKSHALERFTARSRRSNVSTHQRAVDEIVATHGGPTLLARVHDDVTQFVASRPGCVVVETNGQSAQQTFAEVVRLLDQPRRTPPS